MSTLLYIHPYIFYTYIYPHIYTYTWIYTLYTYTYLLVPGYLTQQVLIVVIYNRHICGYMCIYAYMLDTSIDILHHTYINTYIRTHIYIYIRITYYYCYITKTYSVVAM